MKYAFLLTAFVVTTALSPMAHGQPTRLTPTQNGPLRSALEAARTTDYPAAEKALGAIGGADRPQALTALARIMFEQGRFAEAERYAAQSANATAERWTATALRGEILEAQGKVDEAIKLLDPIKDGPGVGGRRVRLVLGDLL
ncbi:MAG: tetratricopeptide repeat protein, partial [Myxococcota bacterium]|nr:tetratricopeptide repeat protein [Myxococcota bacterium]